MAKICVFCSSSNNLHQDYIDTAKQTGKLIGQRRHHLIYGGSYSGLMGETSKEAAKHTNQITEIIPKMFEHIAIKKHDIIVTENLSKRLEQMQHHSDAFIVLPGRFGSLQELLDVLVSKQLKFHNKPLVIININNLYSPIIEQIQKIIDEGLAPKDNHILIHEAKTPEEAIKYIESYIPKEIKNKVHSA